MFIDELVTCEDRYDQLRQTPITTGTEIPMDIALMTANSHQAAGRISIGTPRVDSHASRALPSASHPSPLQPSHRRWVP